MKPRSWLFGVSLFKERDFEFHAAVLLARHCFIPHFAQQKPLQTAQRDAHLRQITTVFDCTGEFEAI
jgi:hypothetical protein